MRSGYKLLWSDRAVLDLQNIIAYLNYKWTNKEVKNFIGRLDKRLDLIAINPKLFPKTGKRKDVRRSVLTRHITLYYKTTDNLIQVISLFDSRQNPKKRGL